MTEFKICLANRVIAVDAIYGSTMEFCRDYLTDAEADFAVSLTSRDIEAEDVRSDRERELEGLPLCKFSSPYLETLALYRKIAEKMIDYGVILFHGSAISVDGEVYIFTAKSGTGKSTHTRLWRQNFGDRAVMVNDDKPLLAIDDKGTTVYGTPWNGKHHLGANISAPLKAICILERSETNHIKRISTSEAFSGVLSQTYRFADPMGMKKTLELIDKMLSTTAVYRLGCNMEQEAATVAYNGMKGKNDEA